MYDRSKIQGASAEALSAQSEEAQSLLYGANKKVDWLEFKSGFNTRRIFPPHPGSTIFIAQKGVHWLPQEITTKGENGKADTVEIKNRPIFNSRIHAGTPEDLVEAYITYAVAQLTEANPGSDKESKAILDKKLAPITDWKAGLGLKATWVAYANAHNPDGTKTFGKQEFTNGVKGQIDVLAQKEVSGKPMLVDVFSHPDNGKAICVKYNPDEKDNKKKYSTTLKWEEEWPLTDEELQVWYELPSLAELFKNSFKRTDFIKQVEGLTIFDQKHNFNFLEHSEFQATIERISNYFPEEENNTTTESSNSASETGKTETKAETTTTKEVEFENPLESFDKDSLLAFIELFQLDLKPRASHGASRIADDLIEVICEKESIDPTNHKKLGKLLDDMMEEFVDAQSANTSGEEEKPKEEEAPAPEESKEDVKTENASATGTDRISQIKNKYGAKKEAE